MDHTNRVVILVDMDCFYCQVEEKLDPLLVGKPIAVVQYNAWRGGGIIAVNYPARDRGVSRHERGQDALKKCPEIKLVQVPEVRGKADLTKYREAGKRVAEVLQTFTSILERASVDEAYLDVTEEVNQRIESLTEPIPLSKMQNTHVVGSETEDFLINSFRDKVFAEKNLKLAVGGLIAEEVRAAVLEKTGYKCSAGISHNKILAKLACGLHKPNQQTILPDEAVSALYQDLPLRKIRNLGGKFGDTLSRQLGIEKMGELARFSEKELAKHFDEKTVTWLYNIARGIDLEPVTTRLISKSIGCCKQFRGRGMLVSPEDVDHWMGELAQEIAERLEKDIEENNRRAKQIVVNFGQLVNKKTVTSSRTQNLSSYEPDRIKQIGIDMIKKFCFVPGEGYRITFLGFSVGNFEDLKNVREITSFFNVSDKRDSYPPKMQPKSSLESFLQNNNNQTEENSEDSPKDEDNSSIYSASTEELNEDLDNLIYYDDVASKKLDNSADSITSEMSAESSNTIERAPSNSFFKKYFENLNQRNFNTSKMLEEENEEETVEENTEECEECNNLVKIEDMQSHIDHHLALKMDMEEQFTQCPDCNKKIPTQDFQSHQDYHFALKMVKEESHLYKTTPQPQSTSKEEKRPNSRNSKRKLNEPTPNKTGTIKMFLKTDNLDENNSEVCTVCSKKIKLDEFASHLDYHEAQKLHQLLNATAKMPTKTVKKDNSKKATKNDKMTGKNQTIVSFFKP